MERPPNGTSDTVSIVCKANGSHHGVAIVPAQESGLAECYRWLAGNHLNEQTPSRHTMSRLNYAGSMDFGGGSSGYPNPGGR
jgi:hypothetical protein